MRLNQYIELRRAEGVFEGMEAFAGRLGISRQALARILDGGGVRADTALRIIDETQGLVRLEDLVQVKSATEATRGDAA